MFNQLLYFTKPQIYLKILPSLSIIIRYFTPKPKHVLAYIPFLTVFLIALTNLFIYLLPYYSIQIPEVQAIWNRKKSGQVRIKVSKNKLLLLNNLKLD